MAKVLILILLVSQVHAKDLLMGEGDGWSSGENNFLTILKKHVFINTPHSIKTFPLKRMLKVLNNKEATCIIGGDKNALKLVSGLNFISSSPFFETNIRVFSLSGQKVITKVKELNNKVIGFTRGVDYKALGLDIKPKRVVYYNNQEQALLLLKSKRIDVVTAFEPMMDKAFYGRVTFSEKLSLLAFNESINCIDNKENKIFLNEINQKLKEEKVQKLIKEFYLQKKKNI